MLSRSDARERYNCCATRIISYVSRRLLDLTPPTLRGTAVMALWLNIEIDSSYIRVGGYFHHIFSPQVASGTNHLRDVFWKLQCSSYAVVAGAYRSILSVRVFLCCVGRGRSAAMFTIRGTCPKLGLMSPQTTECP